MPFLMMQEKITVLQHQKCMVPIIVCEHIKTDHLHHTSLGQ